MDGERFRRSILYAVLAITIFVGPFLYGYYVGVDTVRLPSLELGFSTKAGEHLSSATALTKDLHFLIPATSPGIHLCKLLLTGAILGYPEPTLLGWDHRGVFDGYKTHLFKITQTVNYLRALPPSADNDLVFLIDGYDIWLQLRPDVLLKRYYALIKKNDDRLREEGILGLGLEENGAEIRSKLIFGADKFPGPPLFSEPFVWAVPNSTLPDDVFGPKTGEPMDYHRPQYLNSGTIIGPVKDMREFFEAAEDEILREAGDDDTKLEHSDQYYFGHVWGPQEIGRQIVRDGDAFLERVPDGAHIPDRQGMRKEFGVFLDQEHEIFQLASAWMDWLVKLKFDGSETPEFAGELSPALASKAWTLPEDVLQSEGPYAALEPGEIPGHPTGWANVSLGANAVNRQPYGLIHLTGDKRLREKWWPDQWFHPDGEVLQKATRRRQAKLDEPEVFVELDGIRHRQVHKMFTDQEKAGAWRPTGEYLSWDSLCHRPQDLAELYTPGPYTG